MKRISILFILFCLILSSCEKDKPDVWTAGDDWIDTRDGQSYTTVQIGDQVWMAENLNYYTPTGSWYFNNDSVTYADTLGRLYNWAASMDIDQSYLTKNYTTIYPHQGVCPSGWHIPSDEDWKELEIYLGMTPAEADGEGYHRGTDQDTQIRKGGSSGFEALLNGFRGYAGNFSSLGYSFTIHTSTEYSALAAWNRQVRIDSTGINRSHGTQGKKNAFPVRCLKYELKPY
jgi:uncharacterized protein (TIGR02145 family)